MGSFRRAMRKLVHRDKRKERSSPVESDHSGSVGYESADSFPLQKWWERSYWEPTVALAIGDHCRPGDVAFDVGANAGGIALQMSRLVGPRGVVCAFEASPRIIDKTQYNLVQAGCFNTTVYHRAVYHSSNETVTIYSGSHLNDSLYAIGSGPSFIVRTLALDDFVDATGLLPKIVKMDIEGAEFDALRGMTRVLRDASPILILEQSPSDMRCHELLVAAGYRAVDLASYAAISGRGDFPSACVVANVLFVHRDRIAGNPYFSEKPPVALPTLDAGSFERRANGSYELKTPLELPAGRYVLHADFSSDVGDNEVFAGVDADGETIFRYHTNTMFLAASYLDWPIHLQRPARISPFLRFIRGEDTALQWHGVQVRRLPAFDGCEAAVVC